METQTKTYKDGASTSQAIRRTTEVSLRLAEKAQDEIKDLTGFLPEDMSHSVEKTAPFGDDSEMYEGGKATFKGTNSTIKISSSEVPSYVTGYGGLPGIRTTRTMLSKGRGAPTYESVNVETDIAEVNVDGVEEKDGHVSGSYTETKNGIDRTNLLKESDPKDLQSIRDVSASILRDARKIRHAAVDKARKDREASRQAAEKFARS